MGCLRPGWENLPCTVRCPTKHREEAGASFSSSVTKSCHCSPGVSYRNIFRWGIQHVKTQDPSFESLSSYLMPQLCCFPTVPGSCSVSFLKGLHAVLSLRPQCWLLWETTADLFSSKGSPKWILNTYITHILRHITPDIIPTFG